MECYEPLSGVHLNFWDFFLRGSLGICNQNLEYADLLVEAGLSPKVILRELFRSLNAGKVEGKVLGC